MPSPPPEGDPSDGGGGACQSATNAGATEHRCSPHGPKPWPNTTQSEDSIGGDSAGGRPPPGGDAASASDEAGGAGGAAAAEEEGGEGGGAGMARVARRIGRAAGASGHASSNESAALASAGCSGRKKWANPPGAPVPVASATAEAAAEEEEEGEEVGSNSSGVTGNSHPSPAKANTLPPPPPASPLSLSVELPCGCGCGASGRVAHAHAPPTHAPLPKLPPLLQLRGQRSLRDDDSTAVIEKSRPAVAPPRPGAVDASMAPSRIESAEKKGGRKAAERGALATAKRYSPGGSAIVPPPPLPRPSAAPGEMVSECSGDRAAWDAESEAVASEKEGSGGRREKTGGDTRPIPLPLPPPATDGKESPRRR